VQLWDKFRIFITYSFLEQIIKKMMIAIPMALVVQWYEEEIGDFKGFQNLLSILFFSNSVTKRGAQAV